MFLVKNFSVHITVNSKLGLLCTYCALTVHLLCTCCALIAQRMHKKCTVSAQQIRVKYGSNYNDL